MSSEIRKAIRASDAARAAGRPAKPEGDCPEQLAPLLLGQGLPVYSLARAFQEQYRLYATVLGSAQDPVCSGSRLCACLDWDEGDPLAQVRRFADLAEGMPVLVVPAEDSAARRLAAGRDSLPPEVLVCAPTAEALARRDDPAALADACTQAGLTLGGGEPTHCVLGYSSREGRVRLLCCAQLLLRAGNTALVAHAVFLDEVTARVARLMDALGWTGFFLVRLALGDEGEPRLIDLEAAPGDLSHMLTAMGQSPAWWAVEDLYYRHELPYTVTSGHCLWRVISHGACKKRLDRQGMAIVRGMLGFGAVCNPFYTPGDGGPGRRLALRRVWKALDTLE